MNLKNMENEDNLFDKAYPFILPEGENSDLELEEVTIPPKSIIAKLNDQWVKEIGLNINKFGYGHSFGFLLKKKIGIKIHRDNLIEKVRILQTIALVFKYLNEENKNRVMEFIEKEQILYPNLRGSRDKTFFNHKKQITVVLLKILSSVDKENSIKKAILDLLFDILDDNYSVVNKKTYFDDYNSYTYSEDQRQISTLIVGGIEKQLTSMISSFDKDDQVNILRKLWSLSLLKNDLDLRKKIVKDIYIKTDKVSLSDFKSTFEKLKESLAPELEVLKHLISELNINSEEVDTGELINFYSKDLVSSDDSDSSTLLVGKLKKMFRDTKTNEEKEKIINFLISPKKDMEDIFEDELNFDSGVKVIPLVDLFLEDIEAQKIIFGILFNGEDKNLHKAIHSKLFTREELYQQFSGKFTELVLANFKEKDLDIHIDKKFVLNFIRIIENELLDENRGEELIDLLLERRVKCRFSDHLLKQTFKKAGNSNLGRYLQYILLTR